MDVPDLNHLDDDIQIFTSRIDRPAVLTGHRLLSMLQELFPTLPKGILKNIAENEAVNDNDEAALTNIVTRILEQDLCVLGYDERAYVDVETDGNPQKAKRPRTSDVECEDNTIETTSNKTALEIDAENPDEEDSEDEFYDTNNNDDESYQPTSQIDNDDDQTYIETYMNQLNHDLVNHLREAVNLLPIKRPPKKSELSRINKISIFTGPRLFERLKQWFPKMQENILEQISESQAVNENDEAALTDLFCRIIDEDESIVFTDTNGRKSYKFNFIRCRLFPPETESSVLDLEFDNLFRLANDDYIDRYDLPDPPDLSCIDYIYNSELAGQFENTRKYYEKKNILCNERRLFHGTHHDSINPIIDGNFKVCADPVDNVWEDGRRRTKIMMYGAGVYFSDYPTTSLHYGKSLLLCRVLTGKEVVGQNTTGTQQEKICNTLRVDIKDKSKDTSSIYVVKDIRQILPCYIIHMKQDPQENLEDNDIASMTTVQWFVHNSKTISMIRKATQPPDGKMTISTTSEKLPGFEKNSNGTIVATYLFKNGIQGPEQPAPGHPFYAMYFPRLTYFPNNPRGKKIVEMVKMAFDRKLVFQIGRSQTTGHDNGVVWNGIPHKTSKAAGPYGYPDSTYLDHVEKILSVFGITDTVSLSMN